MLGIWWNLHRDDNVTTVSSLLGATHSRKSKRRSYKAVNPFQLLHGKDISCLYVSGKFMHRCPKTHFTIVSQT